MVAKRLLCVSVLDRKYRCRCPLDGMFAAREGWGSVGGLAGSLEQAGVVAAAIGGRR